MLDFFANILGYLLNFIYGITGNFGVSIILFVIIFKILLSPLDLQQRITSIKTMRISDKQKRLQETYKDDPQQMAQQMQVLYKENNISPFAPLSGCLLAILQIIIILSVFYLISQPLEFMKKIPKQEIQASAQALENEQKEQAKEENKEAKEEQQNNQQNRHLSPDMKLLEVAKPGDKYYLNTEFFGLNLSNRPNVDFKNPKEAFTWNSAKLMLIPVMYIILSFMYMDLVQKDMERLRKKFAPKKDDVIVSRKTISKDKNKDNTKDEEKDINKNEQDDEKLNSEDIQDVMMNTNKTLKYIMPIMIFGVTIVTPLGIALYWFTNSLVDLLKFKIVDNVAASIIANEDKRLKENATK